MLTLLLAAPQTMWCAGEGLPAAVPCSMCGEAPAALPHVNCANIDCNELFIACNACKTK